MDAQRAIECHAAELAAVNATAEDHTRLRELLADAERKIDDVPADVVLSAGTTCTVIIDPDKQKKS